MMQPAETLPVVGETNILRKSSSDDHSSMAMRSKVADAAGLTTRDPLKEQWHEFLPKGEWVPDTSVNACMVCTCSFSLWRRRHHCRRCGAVVCAACSLNRTRFVSQDVAGNNNTEEVRVCDKCIKVIDDQISSGLSKRFGFQRKVNPKAADAARELVDEEVESDADSRKRGVYLLRGRYKAELKGSEGNRYITDEHL